jgi:hypothetical protein
MSLSLSARYHRPSRDIVFRNITTGGGYGVTIGSETSGDVINVTFEDINVSAVALLLHSAALLQHCAAAAAIHNPARILAVANEWASKLLHLDCAVCMRSGESSNGWHPYQVPARTWRHHHQHHLSQHRDEQCAAVHPRRRRWLRLQ